MHRQGSRPAAESAVGNVRIAEGFKLDLIYTVPKDTQGSGWHLHNPKGRLIAADQGGKLYRMILPAIGKEGSVEPEPIGVELAGAHGLLYAFDSLYVMVNEKGTHGFYRVKDTDGDDRYDEVKLLRRSRGAGSMACTRSSSRRTESRSTLSAETRRNDKGHRSLLR